jgi:LmbE family N-acetylglucosaminyl deacetylase
MINFIRFSKVFRFFELIAPALKYSFPAQTSLPGKKLLVIAPHPDDEAVACGGAIALNAANGGTTVVVYCTMDDARAVEAREAAKALGVNGAHSLKHSVDSLKEQSVLPKELSLIISQVKPDVVFAPFWLDNHPDHRAAARAFAKAAVESKQNFVIYTYSVWLPIWPNVLLDVSSAWETKKSAINAYGSQLADRDYLAMAEGLATYWAQVKGRKISKAEAYFRISISEYAQWCEKI